MTLLLDIGNTRTKWATKADNGTLSPMQACLNAEIASAQALHQALQNTNRMVASNVAGAKVLKQLQALVPAATWHLVQSSQQACGVLNQYANPSQLGTDRWAALIAAWHLNKQPTLVVNAGTAVTIDALARDNAAKTGVFIGGTIMPGLRLMQGTLSRNTAAIKPVQGKLIGFPKSTADAVQTGCLNAVIGAIMLMQKELEKQSAFLPKLVISGGDANTLAEALKPHIKRVIIAENLILQGLALLDGELL